MLDVVDLGELVVGAAGESTALVPAVDLDPLRRGGISARPTLFEDGPVTSLDRQDDLGVAREPPRDLDLNRPHAGDRGHTLGIGRIARTTTSRRSDAQEYLKRGVDDDLRTKSPPRFCGGLAPFGKQVHQGVVQPLVERHVLGQWGVRPLNQPRRTVPSSAHLG